MKLIQNKNAEALTGRSLKNMGKEEGGTTRDSEESELDYFFRVADASYAEARNVHSQAFIFLAELDRLFVDFLPDAGGTNPTAAGVLIFNAHALFRAAIRSSMGGQLPSVFILLRGSIESALYAHAMAAKPSLQTVWLEREKDDFSRRKCRSEFSTKKVFSHLEAAHEKAFADNVREAYDHTIDFGAHPNSRSLLSSTRIEVVDGVHSLDFAYVHGCSSFELRQSLVACFEVGMLVFFITLICSNKHPSSKELNDRALDLQEKIPAFREWLGFV